MTSFLAWRADPGHKDWRSVESVLNMSKQHKLDWGQPESVL